MKSKLLYEQIADALKEKICNGEYVKDERLPTESDLADQFNVSRITSKRALEELKKEGLIYRVRGSGSFVSEIADYKKRNKEAIVNNGAKATAIIMPHHVTESSFAKSITGAVRAFEKAGFYSVVHSGVKSSEDERRIISKMYDDGIKGIIYYPVSDRENYSLLNSLYLENYPIVTIDKYFESLPISNVVADNYNGGYIAAKYLSKLGHSRIGFVSDLSIESTTSIRNRYFGYAKALRDEGLMEEEEFLTMGFTDEYHRKYNDKVYKDIAHKMVRAKITGVVAVNDLVGAYLLKAAIDCGISVPDELSIIGFDDLEMSKHLQVPLTTIKQDFSEIGRKAAELVIKKMGASEYDYEQIKLPVTIIERDSCAKR